MAVCRLAVLLVAAAVPTAALKASADRKTDVALEALLDIVIHRRRESEGVHADAAAAKSAGEGSDASVTLSPQERAALHASKFEKEFVVDLDMSDAVDKKKSVGVVLDLDTD
ncbi:unnamed protein product, partial [Prorocentrum cordatum]